MTYKIEILPTAWEDLKRIEDWYLVQFGVETALKVSNHILDTIERLEHFPDSGSLTPDEWLNKQGYRMVICGKHVAIYKQIRTSVFIYHIADTQTEYTKLFYNTPDMNETGN
jgi:toxin ParE1/3/4